MQKNCWVKKMIGNKKHQIADAKTALATVKNGDHVVLGHATGEPQHLMEALVARKDELSGVDIIHMVCMGKGHHCLPEMEGHLHHTSMFVGGLARKALAEGRGDFLPVHFSEIPKLFREGYYRVDVALFQVSPPDENGFMSLGISVDYAMEVVRVAKTVIVQVNKNMPRTLGDSFIHVSQVDYMVEYDEPVIELLRGELTEQDRMIGKNCASLVNDGDTLQLGIGALPDAILLSLHEKKDLGIHSEMFSDGVMDLVRMGVINGSKKTLHNGKIVASFIMGSKELYEFANDNPMIYMAPVDYVNDPCVVAQNDNMVSINSCVQVDLMGQVCAESIGLMQISATGGQVDFVRGANMAKNGRSVIAMPSVTKDGKISKIVPFLDEGAAVTTLRNDVRIVVTEFGAAYMFGKTLRERGRALIGIAHPKFREELIAAWEDRFKTKF